jgi:hypothetical protein
MLSENILTENENNKYENFKKMKQFFKKYDSMFLGSPKKSFLTNF